MLTVEEKAARYDAQKAKQALHMVKDRLILQKAKLQGITVPDAEVEAYIKAKDAGK